MSDKDPAPVPAGAPTPERPVPGAETDPAPRYHRILREIATGNVLTTFLAVILAVLIGSILIAATDRDVQTAAGYFFSRPGDTFAAIFGAVGDAYAALFNGAIYDTRRSDPLQSLGALWNTLEFATPLIAAGLGVAIAFRVGLFNIGGRGQILIAAMCAGSVGAFLDLPPVIHALIAVAAGIVGGALWGGLAGLIKARTGAHEVILTIMLNYVAFYLVSYLLRFEVFHPGSSNPRMQPMAENARLDQILPPFITTHWGFVLVVLGTIVAWLIIDRSSLGFQFRAVGFNPNAARTAGIHVNRIYVYAMLIAGGFAGLAASAQVLGESPDGFTSGVDSGVGFDAITVALLGRSTPWGTFAAGILFGAFKSGGFTMASRGIPDDIVLVVQALIVLFLAAPPLIREIFRLPKPGSKPGRAKKAVAA